MKNYVVVYKEDSIASPTKEIQVQARNASEAYAMALETLSWKVWGAYVESYITKDGKRHLFSKNMFGYPY